jgi:hypothetical protein
MIIMELGYEVAPMKLPVLHAIAEPGYLLIDIPAHGHDITVSDCVKGPACE